MRNLIEFEIQQLFYEKSQFGLRWIDREKLKYLKQAKKDWIRVEKKIERMKK